MGFTLRYDCFQSKEFMVAKAKLARYPFKNQKTSYNVTRILKFLDDNEKLAQEQFIKLVKQHAVLDEKGDFVPRKNEKGEIEEGTYTIPEEPEKIAAWKKAKDEFDALEFTVERYKIKLSEMENLPVTPMELGAIDGMIDPEEPAAAPA